MSNQANQVMLDINYPKKKEVLFFDTVEQVLLHFRKEKRQGYDRFGVFITGQYCLDDGKWIPLK